MSRHKKLLRFLLWVAWFSALAFVGYWLGLWARE
jgi:hypothetical protein